MRNGRDNKVEIENKDKENKENHLHSLHHVESEFSWLQSEPASEAVQTCGFQLFVYTEAPFAYNADI